MSTFLVLPQFVYGTNLQVPKPKIKVPLRQETREELHDYADHFFVDSQLHGFREAYTAKDRRTRTFWIIVCLLCGSMALYEIIQIGKTFRNGAIATQISIESDDTLPYPTLLLCPTHWISKRKLSELKIDTRGLDFLSHRMEQVVRDSAHHHPISVSQAVDDYRQQKSPVNISPPKKSEKRLKQWTHNRTDWLLHNLTCFAEVNLKCACCKRSDVETVVTSCGVCHSVPLCNGDYAEKPDVHYKFDWEESKALPSNKYLPPGLAVGLYSSVADISRLRPEPSIFAPVNTISLMILTMSKTVRRKTPKKPCAQADDKAFPRSELKCQSDCVDSIYNKKCFECTVESFMSATHVSGMCHLGGNSDVMNETKCYADRKAVAAELKSCVQQCVPRCETQFYNVYSTIQIKSGISDNETEVRLRFHSFSYTLIEDVSTLEFETFISAIGGQLGLWCGASIISIFQLFSFIICPCIYCKDKTVEKVEILRRFSRSFRERRQTSLDISDISAA